MPRSRILLAFFLGLLIHSTYAPGQAESVEVATGPDRMPGGSEWEHRRNSGGDEVEVHLDSRPPRDPFWPTDYKPKPPAVPGPAAEMEERSSSGPVDFHGLTPEEQAAVMEQLSVGGFLRQNDIYIAIINNQLLSPGDELRIEAIGKKYRFLVKKITPVNVVLHSAD